MKSKSKIVSFVAISLSIIFMLSYGFMSKTVIKKVEGIPFYAIQVGAFSNQENANHLIQTLTTLDHSTYTYQQEGLTYVLTCLSEDETIIEQEIQWLNEHQINHARREYLYLKNEEITIEKMLEVIQNDDQRNASE